MRYLRPIEFDPSVVTVSMLAEFDAKVAMELDAMWLMIGAILVFFMQVGFAMLEAGSVSTKNTRNILMKNVMDASLGTVLFATVGYGFAYGDTAGHGLFYRFVGKDMFLLKAADFEDGTGYTYASWMFQWAMAATTTTIVSGAVAERVTFTAYVVYTICLVGLIYPVVACVVWSSQGFLSAWRDDDKFLGCGVLDFAGSGVVHMTGGVAALVGTTVLGPRRAFLVNELYIPEYGPIMQTLGTLILWFCWYGFNGVSTLYLVGYAEVAAKTMVTTTVSAACGALSSLLASTLYSNKNKGQYQLRLEYANNGALAGLVAISAGCSVVEPPGALIIGLLAGPLYFFTSQSLEHFGIDDVVDAFPVHGMCGAFGVVMAGVLATPHNYANAYYEDKADKCAGVAYGGDGSQLAANAFAVLAILLWSGTCSYLVFKALSVCGVLRVSEDVEDRGMDAAEHNTAAWGAGRNTDGSDFARSGFTGQNFGIPSDGTPLRKISGDNSKPISVADLHIEDDYDDEDEPVVKKKGKPSKKTTRSSALGGQEEQASYASSVASAAAPKKKKVKETEMTSSI